jgi:uncharacterized membrane protein
MIKSYSGGKFTISDIYVKFNGYPESHPIEGYGLDEDTRNNSLIDLTQYFTDDYLASTSLTYKVVDFTNSSIIDVYINDDYYLGVDAETGANNNNWFGQTKVTVSASDDAGLETQSIPFYVKILPVNDEPVVGSKKIPDVAINEGGKSPSIDLDADTYFEDVDNTNLFYDFEIDPLGESDDEMLNATVDPVENRLTVEAYGDWYTPANKPLRFRIYCDDDTGDINLSNAYQDIFITVNNLDDDAPVWSPIPDVVMNEDEKKDDAFSLYTYVSDIDNEPESLKFSIIHVDNNNIMVDIDGNSNVDIRASENYFGTATVDIRASDGTNVGTTSFNIIVNNVNDKPEVELLAPRNGAFVFSDQVELQWKGADVDPGDTANLTYSVYLDTTAGTQLYQSDITGNTLTVTGLTDKSIYYWKVIPNDGIEEGLCVSEYCPSEFTVDIGKKPESELQLPGDEAVTNLDYVVLIWKGFGEADYQITYDIYFANESFESPFPESALIKKGIADSELLVSNLTAGQTYYWTVIPQSAKGVGSCLSGIWTFMYDPTVTPYKFEIDAPETLIFEEGKEYSTAIKIKNTGANTDIFIPDLAAGTLKFAVELEGDGKEFRIEDGGEQILILNISADRIPVGTYEITISAESIGGEKTQDHTITLEITEKKVEEQGLGDVYLFIIPIILIVIIIIVVLFFMMRKKRIEEEKKRVEAELLRPVPTQTMDAADVQYFPGPGGAAMGGPAQLPSVTLPGGAQAGAAPGQAPYGAGQPVLPQLPPAQDTGAAPYPQQTAYPPQQPAGYPEQAPAYADTAPIPPQQPTVQPPAQPPVQPPAQPPTQPQAPTQTPSQELHFKMPQPETPPQQQPAVEPQPEVQPPGQTVAAPQPAAGAAPVQVPYIPRSRNGEAAPAPEEAAAPEQVTEPSKQDPEQLQNILKARFIQGTVSEETYMSLKKELKDTIQSGGSVDAVAGNFITGEITEDEYKQKRSK